MKTLFKILLFTLLTTQFLYGQFSYSGPASGTSSAGTTFDTGTKINGQPGFIMEKKAPKNIFRYLPLATPDNMIAPTGPVGSNFIIDPSLSKETNVIQGPADDFELTDSWLGIPDQQTSIPPDPYVAVGPNHVVAVVNSRIRCWVKSNQSIDFTIQASTFFAGIQSGANPYDPKIIYDHHNGRWVMVWLHGSSGSLSRYLIAASDDNDPNGTWYIWSVDARKNGNTVTAYFADYQGVGYDQDNIYISANMFHSTNDNEIKIRVLDNTNLYANTGAALSWEDIWAITDVNGNFYFTIRPARVYGTPSNYYLIGGSGYVTNTFVTVFTMTGTADKAIAMTADDVPVTAYQHPDDAEQQGSGQSIDGGSAWIRNEPVYRDGVLHFTHAVAYSGYSAVAYKAIDVTTKAPTVDVDVAMGAETYYYTYPALEVDGNSNVVLTYTRSADAEYAGAFYTTYPQVQGTLTGSKLLRPGVSSYFKDFGSGRNRWGDYNGAWLDPSNNDRIYIFTEYVSSTNTWGTYVGELTFDSPTQYVLVTAPNGGELFGVGDNTNITWQSNGVSNVDIEFSSNNGRSWSSIVNSVSAGSGSYAWTVPGSPSSICKIRISSSTKNFLSDESNGVFTINTGGLDWTEVSSGITGDIWSIDWVDENIVWASSTTGDIIRSTNGGNTWSDAGNAGQGAYSIAALSSSTAVVSLGPDAGDGKIMKTTNSGTTWTQKYTASGAWFNFVDNVSSTFLWAQSDPIGGNFHIVKSTDAGDSWILASTLPSQPATNVFGANGSFFRVGSTAWFGTGGQTGATQANRVYKSSNAPDGPWTFGTTTDQFVGTVAFSSESGNGLTGFWQISDVFNKSANGGSSWSNQAAAGVGDVLGLDYIRGTNYAWAATSNGIFQTSNNGSSWSEDAIPPSVTGNVNVVRFYMDSDVGLAGGVGGVLLKSLLGSVVPVEFTSFSAQTYDKSIALSWTTATETNNSGFQVERKINADENWENIAFIPGKGTTTDAQQYSFSDNFIDSYIRGNVNYRLKQVDFDGTISYSKEIKVDVNFAPQSYALQQNFPNPFNPTTTIVYEIAEDGLVSLKVYDILGKEVKQLTNERQTAGKYEIQFDASSLSSGVYFYRLEVNEFTSMKKLVLLK